MKNLKKKKIQWDTCNSDGGLERANIFDSACRRISLNMFPLLHHGSLLPQMSVVGGVMNQSHMHSLWILSEKQDLLML